MCLYIYIDVYMEPLVQGMGYLGSDRGQMAGLGRLSSSIWGLKGLWLRGLEV